MSEDRCNRLLSVDMKQLGQGHEDFLLGFSYVSLEMYVASFQNDASIIIPKTKYLSIYNIYLNLYILNIKQSFVFSHETTQYFSAIPDEPPGFSLGDRGFSMKKP